MAARLPACPGAGVESGGGIEEGCSLMTESREWEDEDMAVCDATWRGFGASEEDLSNRDREEAAGQERWRPRKGRARGGKIERRDMAWGGEIRAFGLEA